MANERLNPPILDGTITAQSSNILKIPFQMNRAVGLADIDGIKISVKTISGSSIDPSNPICEKGSLYYASNSWYGTWNIDPEKFNVGQYYKVQIAYIQDGIVGNYSSVGVFKYTCLPVVSIASLEPNELNAHTYSYTGIYSSEDSSEKVYSYQFILKDASGNGVASSGELLHNSVNDTQSSQSSDTWTTRYDLKDNQIYTIQYSVTTINGLTAASMEYKIINNQTVESNIFRYYDFVATNITDSGCVELSIQQKDKSDVRAINGQFILLRASSEDEFNSWYKLTSFVLSSWTGENNGFLCRDYSVAQGVSYVYAIQAYNNNGIYSKREESEKLFVDFEDMFLGDGERQLRIRFNPKVSSFKNTILENKLDTLGGQFPFFFRNGNVNYKEFSISGLISMLMDDSKEFSLGFETIEKKRLRTPEDADRAESFAARGYDLVGENFRAERDFKNLVLDWLTNGEPKLFRSPAEGNYIVRLMNTSLSPNDTLGRMIHTFSTTAYEIAEYTFDNLRKYGMLMDEQIETRQLVFNQAYLNDTINGTVSGLNACLATVTAWPHIVFKYRLQNDVTEKEAQIGVTGVYVFDSNVLAENPLYSIRSDSWNEAAVLTYASYAAAATNDFSLVHNIKIEDCIDRWIGSGEDEIEAHVDAKRYRIAIGNIYYLRVEERPIVSVLRAELNVDNTYRFYEGDNKRFYPTDELIVEVNGEYYDGKTKKKIDKIDYGFDYNYANSVDMGGQSGAVHTNGRITLTNLNNVESLCLGNGVYADIVYQKSTKYYTFEQSGSICEYRKAWEYSGSTSDYNTYYNALCQEIESRLGGMSIDAL